MLVQVQVLSPAIVTTTAESAPDYSSAFFLHTLGWYWSGVALKGRLMASIQKNGVNWYRQFCYLGNGTRSRLARLAWLKPTPSQHRSITFLCASSSD